MKKRKRNWKWIDENGRSWSAEQVEHKFDTYIKRTLKRLVKDAVGQYIRQLAKFPIQPDDILAEAATVELKSNLELVEVKLDKETLYLENEELARAIGGLKPWEKKLIELDFVSDCTEEDIAECLDIERESVFTYRYRVLRKLEKLMEAADGKR